MAEAELIISPEVQREALEKTIKKMDRALSKSADNAGLALEKQVSGGLAEGSKKGSKNMLKSMKGGLAKLSKGIAGAVAGSLTAGIMVAGSRVNTAETLISSLLEERDASELVNFSKLQHSSLLKVSNVQNRTLQAGGDEQTARDFLVDTSEFIAQAKAGEHELLKQFVNVQGGSASQFNAIIATLQEKDAETRNKFLADIGWAGDSAVIAGMMESTRGMNSKQAFTYLESASNDDRKRATLIEQEAKLEKIWQKAQLQIDLQVKDEQLKALTPATIARMIEGQTLKKKQEIEAIINYKENLTISQDVEKVQREMADSVLQLTRWVWDILRPKLEYYIKLFDEFSFEETITGFYIKIEDAFEGIASKFKFWG